MNVIRTLADTIIFLSKVQKFNFKASVLFNAVSSFVIDQALKWTEIIVKRVTFTLLTLTIDLELLIQSKNYKSSSALYRLAANILFFNTIY